MVAQISKGRNRYVASLEDGLAFLAYVDSTLPDIETLRQSLIAVQKQQNTEVR